MLAERKWGRLTSVKKQPISVTRESRGSSAYVTETTIIYNIATNLEAAREDGYCWVNLPPVFDQQFNLPILGEQDTKLISDHKELSVIWKKK